MCRPRSVLIRKKVMFLVEIQSYGDSQPEMGLHSNFAFTSLEKTLNLSEPQFPIKRGCDFIVIWSRLSEIAYIIVGTKKQASPANVPSIFNPLICQLFYVIIAVTRYGH